LPTSWHDITLSKTGQFVNVEETLLEHAANDALCNERAAMLEAEVMALRQAIVNLN
jgi:hypothetical protein